MDFLTRSSPTGKTLSQEHKAELDVSFLRSCKTFNVFPKFVYFPLPNTNRFDVLAIRKCLLRTAISKRQKELNKLSCDCDKLTERVKNSSNSVDWYFLNKALKNNVDKNISKVIHLCYVDFRSTLIHMLCLITYKARSENGCGKWHFLV